MTNFLLLILAVVGLIIISQGLMNRERMIQYPFLAAGVFIGWVFPQLLGLSNKKWLPPGALDKTIAMAIFCLIAAWIGYEKNKRPAFAFNWSYNRSRLLIGAFGLMIFGGYFFYQVSLLAPEAGTQWSGPITILFFLSSTLSFGFAIALILFINRPSFLSLAGVIFGLLFYLDRIVIHGRRTEIVELGLMLLLALWFTRRRLPSRILVVISFIAGALLVNSIGDYRNVMIGDSYGWSGAGLSDILSIDFIGNLRNIAEGNSLNYELANTAMSIEAVDHTSSFDFGLSLWNGFVHRFISGQLIGPEFKSSLIIRFGNDPSALFGYSVHTGSTYTGISDAYLSFWFFGAIKFYLTGLILSRWYRAAMQGNLVWQLVLMLTVASSLLGITHSTDSFFLAFIPLMVFLLPVLRYARCIPSVVREPVPVM